MKEGLIVGILAGFILTTCLWAGFVHQQKKDVVKAGFMIVESKLYHVSEVTLK